MSVWQNTRAAGWRIVQGISEFGPARCLVRVSNNFGLPRHQLKTARDTAQAVFRHQ